MHQGLKDRPSLSLSCLDQKNEPVPFYLLILILIYLYLYTFYIHYSSHNENFIEGLDYQVGAGELFCITHAG